MKRDQFRESVFERDNHLCVICKLPAVDAHHIMERRLFPDGGYYIDNGASLCEDHHLEAEMTIISVEDILEACNINKRITPPHLYVDQRYDKWGNPFIDSNRRGCGELFFDESVQKILKRGNVLSEFTSYVKYPRTYHLPWSPGISKDDRSLPSTTQFEGKEVVVTVKMDGENTSMYNDYIHARSISPSRRTDRSWVKNFHSKISYDIPKGWRICGENLYVKHSIYYDNLPSFFCGFSVWNSENKCLSWEDTLDYFELLDIETVPVLYKGLWDEELIKNIHCSQYDGCECEGYVVRISEEFDYRDFKDCVGKYVRDNHINPHMNLKNIHRGIFDCNKTS